MLCCEQCKVWGWERTFGTVEEAEQHVLDVHPIRLLRQYRAFAGLTDDPRTERKHAIEHAMAARKE